MMTVVPMPEPRGRVTPEEGHVESGVSPVTPETSASRAKKKKDKVRSAWISFAGRIVAQVTGAMVSVALALLVLHKGAPEPKATKASPTPVQVVDVSPAAHQAGPAPRIAGPAIAVLPLDNFSGNPAEDAMADGMTEALVAELAQIPGLTVISRTSAMRFRGARKPLPEIARELGATHLIEGSLVADKGRMRVTAQLIDASSDRHLWAHTYDRAAGDVLGVQAEVARTIAGEVGAAIVGGTDADR